MRDNLAPRQPDSQQQPRDLLGEVLARLLDVLETEVELHGGFSGRVCPQQRYASYEIDQAVDLEQRIGER